MTSGMEESGGGGGGGGGGVVGGGGGGGGSFPHFWLSRWMRTKIEEEKK